MVVQYYLRQSEDQQALIIATQEIIHVHILRWPIPRLPSTPPAYGNQNSQSVRSPSATLVVVAVTQVQFLATTSLVDSGESEATVFSDFTDNLR